MNDLFNAYYHSFETRLLELRTFFVVGKNGSEVAFGEKDGVLLYLIAVNEPNVVLLIFLLAFHLTPQLHQHDCIEEG